MTGGTATAIGTATALFGATVVFAELQSSLNSIWNVKSEAGIGLGRIIYIRAVSFGLVLGIGLLLLVSLALSATLSAISEFLSNDVPVPPFLLTALNHGISFGMIPLLLALAYKLLPDAPVAWSDVWFGAVVTAVLLAVGKSIIGEYLGRSSLTSVYGAAGSLVIILAWVYYSAQVFFFGAELTKVYASRYGSYAPAHEVESCPAGTDESC
jgi:membrane protein